MQYYCLCTFKCYILYIMKQKYMFLPNNTNILIVDLEIKYISFCKIILYKKYKKQETIRWDCNKIVVLQVLMLAKSCQSYFNSFLTSVHTYEIKIAKMFILLMHLNTWLYEFLMHLTIATNMVFEYLVSMIYKIILLLGRNQAEIVWCTGIQSPQSQISKQEWS